MALKPPVHIKQLDGSAKAGANCGMAASAMAVNFATQGYRKPTPSQMRKRAGKPSGPGDAMNTANQEKAIESFDGKGEHDGNSDSTGGRKPLVYYRKVQQPWSVAQTALSAHKLVNCQIDYDVINRRVPSQSGDPNFMGDHSVTLYGRRKHSSGVWQVGVYDSLCDGRRSGIPKGMQWMKESVVKEAAEKFAGKKGTFTGGVVNASPLIPKPTPPKPPGPTPPKPTTPPVPDVSAEDRYREALEEAQAIIEAALTPVATVIADTRVESGASDEGTEPPVTPKPEDDDEGAEALDDEGSEE